MGGDRAPAEIVAGGRRAAAELGVPVILVGRPDRIDDPGDLEVFAASEVIGMADDPARAVRTGKDSSLVRAAELVRDGKASAMVSAGNTGAAVAAALLRMGRIRGVSRPAVAAPIPVPGSSPTVLLDAGAMADCQPEWLVQFALMGSVYSATRYGLAEPRVGLLSIGEEPAKGNAFVKQTHGLLAAATGLNFVGNVEGRDVMSPDVDVVVTDGFTGNVVLKTLEGGLTTLVRSIGGVLLAPEAGEAGGRALELLGPLAEQMDPDRTGGAMLLGVDGVCIISHGSSGPAAIVSAVSVAAAMVEAGLVEAIAAAVGANQDQPHR
jgi:phosphate acyltransferase